MYYIRGYDVMVTYNFAEVDSRVRFSLPAPITCTGDRAANVADCKSVKSWVRVPPCAPNNGVLSVVACTLVCDPGSMSSILIEHPNFNASETWKSERSYKPFSARLAFLRGFDPLRWYQYIVP